MRHAAKVDWLVGIGMLAGLVVPFVSAVEGYTQWGYAASILVALLVFGFCYPQWYETDADALVIRAGVITRRIPYLTITAVRPSSARRSSFAMSLDRVEIEYGSKRMLIAPKNQDAFFSDIAARAPQLLRQGRNPAPSFASIE
ncbi:MAG: PH domain-containing protein [Bryobacteraceae bacterium]